MGDKNSWFGFEPVVLSKNSLTRFGYVRRTTLLMALKFRVVVGQHSGKSVTPELSKKSLTRFVRATEAKLMMGLRFSVVVGQQSSKSVTHFDRAIRVF